MSFSFKKKLRWTVSKSLLKSLCMLTVFLSSMSWSSKAMVTQAFSQHLKNNTIKKITAQPLSRDTSVQLEMETSQGQVNFVIAAQDMEAAYALLQNPAVVGKTNAETNRKLLFKKSFVMDALSSWATASPAGAFLLSTVIASNHQSRQ